MSGWSFKREFWDGDGGPFPTDGEYAENFLSGIRVGVSRRSDIRGWTEGLYGLSTGFVYFFGIGQPYVTHVKIGYTTDDPQKRLASLQTGCPFRIDVLGFVFGTTDMERELHSRLAEHRSYGEWFVFTDEVDTVVRSMLEGRAAA